MSAWRRFEGGPVRARSLSLSVVLVGMLSLAAGASAAHWKWSKPYGLPGANQGISSISCPSPKLCVAAAAVGNPETTGTNDIFWTTNPTGGKHSWHHVALERSVQPLIGGSQEEVITAVSCGKAGTAFHCGASDGFANFWQTGAPASGIWNSQIPDDVGLDSLSCWSAWCAMLDANSAAVVAIGATIDSVTSNVFNIPEAISQETIDCNTSAFCAAVDVSHTLVWTTDATAQPPVWHKANVHGGSDLDTIACPTAHLCVATEGELVGFTAQIGVWHPGSSFKAVKLPAKLDTSVYNVTCHSASFCAVTGSQHGVAGPGFVLFSSHPAAKVSAWHRVVVPLPDPTAIACPTTSECIVGEGQGGKVTVGRKGP